MYEIEKNKIKKQLLINQEEMNDLGPEEAIKIEGIKTGSYIKIEICSVPYEFVLNFNPSYPVIVGGLLPNEQSFGFVQVFFSFI